MTVIACRDGVMAADSRFTLDTEAGGTRVGLCVKLFELDLPKARGGRCVVGVSGDSSPGMVFLSWLRSRSRKVPPDLARQDVNFHALLLNANGLYLYDKWCTPDKIEDDFWAIGSGSKAALAAMHMGATAEHACRIACLVDPYCATPIKTLKL